MHFNQSVRILFTKYKLQMKKKASLNKMISLKSLRSRLECATTPRINYERSLSTILYKAKFTRRQSKIPEGMTSW